MTLISRNALQSHDSHIWEFVTWVRETYVYDTDVSWRYAPLEDALQHVALWLHV